eukprot:839537_1
MDHCLHIACCKYQRPTVMQIDYLVHLKCVMIILYLGLIGIESWIIFNNLLAAFDNEICAMANDCITPFIIIVMWDVFARYGTQMWAIYFVNYLAIHTQLMRTFRIHVLSHKMWDPGIPTMYIETFLVQKRRIDQWKQNENAHSIPRIN